MARPTLYTPKTVNAICEAIREGNSQDDAARLAGVGVTTFYEWLKQPSKAEFRNQVEKAHADFKQKNVLAIRAAGVRSVKGELRGQWQANAWLLERKYPDEFGQRLTIRVTPEQAAILKKVGKSAGDAFEEFMQNLEAELKNG